MIRTVSQGFTLLIRVGFRPSFNALQMHYQPHPASSSLQYRLKKSFANEKDPIQKPKPDSNKVLTSNQAQSLISNKTQESASSQILQGQKQNKVDSTQQNIGKNGKAIENNPIPTSTSTFDQKPGQKKLSQVKQAKEKLKKEDQKIQDAGVTPKGKLESKNTINNNNQENKGLLDDSDQTKIQNDRQKQVRPIENKATLQEILNNQALLNKKYVKLLQTAYYDKSNKEKEKGKSWLAYLLAAVAIAGAGIYAVVQNLSTDYLKTNWPWLAFMVNNQKSEIRKRVDAFTERELPKLPYYKKQGNSTHARIKEIFNGLESLQLTIITGQSGIGKTTSIIHFINDQRKQEKICYLSLGVDQEADNNVLQFQKVLQTLRQIKRRCQKGEKHTVFIDNINHLEELTNFDDNQQIYKILLIKSFLNVSNQNLKICLISSSSSFSRKLKQNANLNKWGPRYQKVQPKRKQQQSDCIQNFLNDKKIEDSYFKSLTMEQQTQLKQFLLYQGHNLRECQKFLKELKKNKKQWFATLKNEKPFASKDSEMKEFLKFSESKSRKQQKSKINNLLTGKTSQAFFAYKKALYKTLASETNMKAQDCDEVLNNFKEQFKKQQKHQIRKASYIEGKLCLSQLEKQKLLVECRSRSEFIRKTFEELASQE